MTLHKRNGGKFLWKQKYNARCAGVRTIYGAMWDEYVLRLLYFTPC